MRNKIIAGNWKMFNDITESQNLITKLISGLSGLTLKCEVVICPPYTSLSEAGNLVKNSSVKLGAQNMYFEDNGAFTGEVSASMLKSTGCEYVILGHSERRTIFGENDQLINKKVIKALNSGLNPIFCIGETLSERESGITFDVIKRQVTEGLKNVSSIELSKLVIAYEPVWAIGTGKTATPEQAQEVHAFIRSLISELYSSDEASKIVIQYGGSVKPENAAELLRQPDIDGALVGGACLKADSFISIIRSI
ncbi:MAG: triose-phosphate isomerase [Ignavibacteriales bacterium]|nr:MAG: triose-phosphate isomerase [Ignavibacteriales bacterium]